MGPEAGRTEKTVQRKEGDINRKSWGKCANLGEEQGLKEREPETNILELVSTWEGGGGISEPITNFSGAKSRALTL